MKTTRVSRSTCTWFFKALALGSAVLSVGCGTPKTDSPLPSGTYSKGAEYSREHNGLALIVYANGSTVYTDNENGGAVDQPNQIFSGTKSFNCALAVSALADGLMTSFDENVSNTIVEWQPDSLKSQITVRQLLSLTSGLVQTPLNLLFFDINAFEFTVGIQATSTPGSTFEYGETHMEAFEEFMQRKLTASGTFSAYDPLTYLKMRVLDPITLHYSNWLYSSRGAPFMSFGAYLTAQEWLKYGVLFLGNGTYNSNSILNGANLAQCQVGSAANAGYGLGMWLNADMPVGFSGFQLAEFVSKSFTKGGPTGLIWPGGDSDLYAFVGVGDNRVYIFPSRNMVVVRMARGGIFSAWSDADFLNALFNND